MQIHYVMTILNFPVLFSNQEFKSTSTDLNSKVLAIELRKVTSLKIVNDNYYIPKYRRQNIASLLLRRFTL